MSITLELKPDVEARLTEQAERQGVPLEKHLESVIDDYLSEKQEDSPSQTLSGDEWEKKLMELGTSSSAAKAPPLSDEAMSRESIYREREDAQL